MTTKKKRTTTTNRRAAFAVGVVCVLVATLGAAPQKKKEAPARATILGTVFKDPGFAFPDAKVTLFLKAEPKPKKLDEGLSNYRGEFRFEVPAVEAKYLVRATFKGFHPAEKEISVSGEERIEATLVLVPESKK